MIKMKLTDIGFYWFSGYRNGLFSDIGMIDFLSFNFWYKHNNPGFSLKEEKILNVMFFYKVGLLLNACVIGNQ